VTTRTFLYLAALAAAAAAGFELRGPGVRPAQTPAPARPPAPVVIAPATDLARVRAVVREEIAAALAARPAPAPVEAPPPAPGRPAAFATAQRLVDDALARRSWGRDDMRSLHEVLGELDPEQADTVLSTLHAALNRGEVQLEAGASVL
jgi:hypothetical protein